MLQIRDHGVSDYTALLTLTTIPYTRRFSADLA